MAVSKIASKIIRISATITTDANGNAPLGNAIPSGYAPVSLTYSWQTVFALFGWNHSGSQWYVRVTNWSGAAVSLNNVDVAIWCIKQ